MSLVLQVPCVHLNSVDINRTQVHLGAASPRPLRRVLNGWVEPEYYSSTCYVAWSPRYVKLLDTCFEQLVWRVRQYHPGLHRKQLYCCT